MTVSDLLTQLRSADVMISVVDDDLIVRGRNESLNPTLLSQLRQHKAALIDLLRARDTSDSYLSHTLPLLNLSQTDIDTIVGSVPGGVDNVQDIYPLAPVQEGILFHHLLNGAGDPYLLVYEFSFDSRARLDRYLNAVQAVVDRQDILRTAIVWEGVGAPVQVVWRQVALPMEEIKLDPLMGDVGEQLYARYDPRRFRIDVRQAPLLRVYFAHDKAKDRWLMVQLLHHLAGDHTTLEIMQAEVQAHLLGTEASLPAPLPFRNLVSQARLGVSREEHEIFFRKMLGDIDEPTAPFGLRDVQGDGSGIEQDHLSLDHDLSGRLCNQARRLGVSTASLFHLAWARVLAKLAGREDVVFGTVMFGRMQGSEASGRVMGPFMNTLPLRISIGEEGVESAVRRTHDLLTELMRHEHASLALAQRCSAVPAPTPLFSALLNYRHSPRMAQKRSEQAIQVWEGVQCLRGEERTNYPITLSIDDLGQEFKLAAQVPASIGAERMCNFMDLALESLTRALEQAPTTAVCKLQVLNEREREQVLYEWNRTEKEFPKERCIHQLFEEQVAKAPEATAVVFEDESLSYAELNRRANRLAHHLREMGVRPDGRVAICVERNIEMAIGLLGILKAGGAYVPLDPGYPMERLRWMLEDSASAVLLTQGKLRELFAGIGKSVAVVDLADTIAGWRKHAEGNPDSASIGLTSEHLAYVIYTSGSTGRPKAVLSPHRATTNRLAWMYGRYPFRSNEVCCVKTSMSFVDFVSEFFGPLLAGVPIVILRSLRESDPLELGRILARRHVTRLVLVPSLLRALLESHARANAPLPKLRYWIVSGEPLPGSLATELLSQIGDGILLNLYGSSEDAGDVTCCEVTPRICSSVVPIGRPIANTRIYILDKYREPVPIGVSGEICVGGPGVARGYLNREELTADRFIPDPFVADGEAWMYRTGDLGKWSADGTIEFLGRTDLQVKIRGFRVELGEIEARLGECAGVRQVAVIAREDTGGEKRLVAYYTSSSDEGVSTEELRASLTKRLPEHMMPVAYVHMEALPLTANGKLDRKALPAPETNAYGVLEYEPPVAAIEKTLARIWSEVLKVERVGRRDNFFHMGGHSLLAVRVVSRIRQELGVEAEIADLFARPQLAELARGLESAPRAMLPPITRREQGERIPVSFAQQRLWFLAQMDGVSEVYHLPLGVRLEGALNPAALRRALNRIVARHEALRTTFTWIDGNVVQRITNEEEVKFHLLEHDLTEEEESEEVLKRLVEEEASNKFDLEQGPLIRGRLIRQGQQEHTLLITMHHIVSDLWSIGVMIQELSTLYGAYVRGEADPLPELKVQYADYAVWQRKWVDGEVLRAQGKYWQETLAGVPTLLDLPADHARPAQQDYRGAYAEVVLEKELTSGLKELSRRHGTTLHTTLLVGWAVLLGRLSGVKDVVVGTPVANRGRMEIEELIGFFVNTLALRVDLSGSPSVSELLGRVRAQTLAAQKNQDMPFEQVVEMVRPVRCLAYSPLFQVFFAWQNIARAQLKLPGLELKRPVVGPHVTARFDLTLSLQEAGERIEGGLEYAAALFEESTIQRYLGYYRRLLESMVADETQAVDCLQLLPQREREQVLYEWNRTETDYSNERCIHQMFEEQVAKTGEATAVVFEDESLSYADLNCRANQLANYLRTLGAKPDQCVAICLERSPEMIIALLAVLKAGSAYVPLDPQYPPERLRFMLEDSKPRALLTQKHLKNMFSGTEHSLVLVDINDSSAWRSLSETNPDIDAVGVTPRHLAYIIYTSGSTGTPKGVMVEHRSVCNYLYWATATYSPTEGAIVSSSLSFDATITSIFSPLLCGGCIRLLPEREEMDALYRQLHACAAPQLIKITPTHLDMLQQRFSLTALSSSSVKIFVVGGEALSPYTVRAWLRMQPHVRFVNEYGPTETVVGCVTYELPYQVNLARSIPIGRPIANTRIYILDEQREPVPVGVVGELYIGGAGVARGYLNRGELTAERFVKDPFVEEVGARMYRTGDLGRWLADGNIEFLGRNDFQVKIRGFRIELGEIETRLCEQAGVREAVVVAREDTPGDKRLVAYYTTRANEEGEGPEGEVGAEQLRSHLAASLPEYMVPAAYVRLESLPLTANGKLDRKALPAPGAEAYSSQAYEPPQGETETRLAEIWADLLRLDRVGRYDDFFALGGHSLLAIRAVIRIQQGFNIDLPLPDFFAKRQLCEMSEEILNRQLAQFTASDIANVLTPSSSS